MPPWGPWSNHPPSCVEWGRKEWWTFREEELRGEGSAAGEQEVRRGNRKCTEGTGSAEERAGSALWEKKRKKQEITEARLSRTVKAEGCFQLVKRWKFKSPES